MISPNLFFELLVKDLCHRDRANLGLGFSSPPPNIPEMLPIYQKMIDSFKVIG